MKTIPFFSSYYQQVSATKKVKSAVWNALDFMLLVNKLEVLVEFIVSNKKKTQPLGVQSQS